MPTERNIVDYVLDRVGREASARAMSGEYGVYFQSGAKPSILFPEKRGDTPFSRQVVATTADFRSSLS